MYNIQDLLLLLNLLRFRRKLLRTWPKRHCQLNNDTITSISGTALLYYQTLVSHQAAITHGWTNQSHLGREKSQRRYQRQNDSLRKPERPVVREGYTRTYQSMVFKTVYIASTECLLSYGLASNVNKSMRRQRTQAIRNNL